MFNFNFRTVENRRDLDRLIEFLRTQDLKYPNYQDWVSRTEEEVKFGYKTGVVAESDGIIIGDVIWQPHKQVKGVREIKNMRVHPHFKRRYGARFLLKQAEAENPDYEMLMLDLREDHPDKGPLIGMLTSMRYREFGSRNLYDSNVRDIMFVKDNPFREDRLAA